MRCHIRRRDRPHPLHVDLGRLIHPFEVGPAGGEDHEVPGREQASAGGVEAGAPVEEDPSADDRHVELAAVGVGTAAVAGKEPDPLGEESCQPRSPARGTVTRVGDGGVACAYDAAAGIGIPANRRMSLARDR